LKLKGGSPVGFRYFLDFEMTEMINWKYNSLALMAANILFAAQCSGAAKKIAANSRIKLLKK
jgi:hypothetical protein